VVVELKQAGAFTMPFHHELSGFGGIGDEVRVGGARGRA
jgi:hypothetical protein